nr:hypothetical protein [Pseudarthrobacter sp. SSS035]
MRSSPGKAAHDPSVATRSPPGSASTAAKLCPSLGTKNITPHTPRHTTAIRMLDAGIDITTIALWLGDESTNRPRHTSTPTWG